MIKSKLQKLITEAFKKNKIPVEDVEISYPVHNEHGDFTTNTVLRYAKLLKKNPMELGTKILDSIESADFIEKKELVKPGFINFWLTDSYYLAHLRKIEEEQFDLESLHLGKNKKVIIEFAHPNTHKLFHIGHLRNITSGEALSRILTRLGNNVIRANYQGDVGLHIAKCLWQLQIILKKQGDSFLKDKTLHEKIALLGQAYSDGSKAYESNPASKEQIIELNRMIYEQHGDIIPLWKETRQWSLEYFNAIYKRVNTTFNRLFFESELPERAKEIVKEALKKKVLSESKGAVVFKGEKHNLDTRVFLNSIGLPTYEGKELALAEKEFSVFGEVDRCIHIVGPEQSSFFNVTFKVEELLDPKKYKDKQFHLTGGWVRLKHGKMSSRSGVVIEGEWLLNEAKKRILKEFKCDDSTAEIVAVAAVKYSFLKKGISSEMIFDFDESISMDGNSGPYLLYAYVRTQSVLKKAGVIKKFAISTINREEKALLQKLHKFPEIVLQAGESFSPSVIAHYLYGISQDYNLFYQKHSILKAEPETLNFRVILTKHVGHVIKTGLNLLGIETVEQM